MISSYSRCVESLTSLQRANVPGAFYLSSPVEMSEIVREGLHADASLIESTNNPKRNPSRIIRTFKEIEVPKVVTSEEWYEEMDCGMSVGVIVSFKADCPSCSHIIGVPHALVPCGHTFCGPCAWQWIKSNQASHRSSQAVADLTLTEFDMPALSRHHSSRNSVCPQHPA